MSNHQFDQPRPSNPVPSCTSAVIKDDAEVFDVVINGDGTVTTRTGKTLLTVSEATKKFGFGVADFTFATGGTIPSLNILVTNSPTDNYLYKYVGAGTAPLTILPGTNPAGNPDWEAFAATVHNTLSGRDEADCHPASAISDDTRGVTAQETIDELWQTNSGAVKSIDLVAWQTVVDISPLNAKQFISVKEAGAEIEFRVSGDNEITILSGVGSARTITVEKNLDDCDPVYIDGVYGESLASSVRRSFLSHIYDAAKMSPWGDSPINILGDSISQGANATDAPRNSWASLLKRNASIDTQSKNYGFISLNDQIGGGLYKDIADITRTGAWTEKTLADAADSISGFYLSSSTVGNKLDISLPMVGQSAYVWFKGRADGATLDVKVNDVSVSTLNTAAQGDTSGFLKYGPYNLSDDGKGSTKLTLEVTGAGVADLVGISVLDDVLGPQVNNFSQSGRMLQHITQDIANKAAQGARVLVLALGHNDYPSDDTNEAAIVQAADYIINACNTYNTKLVVADFVWYRKLNNITRRELKRIADSVDASTYLPFPDWFYTDLSTTPSSTYLINDLKVLDDASHPNNSGHEIISEAIARACGLSSTSKHSALSEWVKWWPLELSADATNVFTTSALNSAIMVTGGVLSIRLYIDLAAALSAETVVANLPDWAQSPYTSNAVFRCGTGDAEEAMVKVSGSNLSIKPIGAVTATRFVAQFNFPLK